MTLAWSGVHRVGDKAYGQDRTERNEIDADERAPSTSGAGG
jgi:hypothetical protein